MTILFISAFFAGIVGGMLIMAMLIILDEEKKDVDRKEFKKQAK